MLLIRPLFLPLLDERDEEPDLKWTACVEIRSRVGNTRRKPGNEVRWDCYGRRCENRASHHLGRLESCRDGEFALPSLDRWAKVYGSANFSACGLNLKSR